MDKSCMEKHWDKICIEALEIYGRHGVYPEENALGQKFLIDAQLFIEAGRAARQDDLEQSVNYGEVCFLIRDWMEQHTVRLIETVADALAREILLRLPLVKKVVLEVKKPNAPIPLPFGSVSVEVERQWHTVYVGIGSNMGEREAYLRAALQLLSAQPDCRLERVSSWYETAPYGYTEQRPFINGCLQVNTLQSAEQFLETLHAIEQELGRERLIHWGPRTIDLDILFYDDAVIHSEQLMVPHIDLQNRMFVLQPLDEIAGFVWHPLLQQTVHQLYRQLERRLLQQE